MQVSGRFFQRGGRMNKVNLIGRLTADPEVRYTQGDQPMCIASYRLAVERGYLFGARLRERASAV